MIRIFGSYIWQLIYQADWMTWFVLLTLLFMSIICWSILLYKVIIWRIKKRQLKNALSNIKNAKSLEDILYMASKFSRSLPGYFLSRNFNFLKSLLMTEKGTKSELADRDWEFLNHMVYNSIDNIMHQEESYLPVLSISAAVSPLVGLFGTVWGLIHAFVDISKKQSADITTVAPGIAEALITTLAGLMVAIPALIMYYYLKLQAASIEQHLIILSDRFLALVQKLFTKSGE